MAERLRSAAILTGSTAGAPWIDALENQASLRLPRSFGEFVRRHAFQPFEWDSIHFFGNSGVNQDEDICLTSPSDPTIWDITTRTGFFQFGRPAGGSYDPICFDVRLAGNRQESPVVQLDHEVILTKQRVRIKRHIAPSFVALAESLLAKESGPVAVD